MGSKFQTRHPNLSIQLWTEEQIGVHRIRLQEVKISFKMIKYLAKIGISENSPEKTPNAETTRNGDVAETMNATAVVNDVKNIAIAERLKKYIQCEA